MTNAYENLYNRMKEQFTVESGDNEYTLGEYMLTRARGNRSSECTAVTAPERHLSGAIIHGFVAYVAEKLAVKSQPAPEKTIRSTPFRTVCASLACAMLVGCLFVSLALIRPATSGTTVPPLTDSETVDEETEVRL